MARSINQIREGTTLLFNYKDRNGTASKGRVIQVRSVEANASSKTVLIRGFDLKKQMDRQFYQHRMKDVVAVNI